MKTIVGRLLILACFLITGFNSTKAEPASYINGELLISQGMMIEDSRDTYYRNIKFTTTQDGSLKLVRAQERKLILLEEVELNQVYGNPVQVELHVSGYKSMPCTELEPVAIRRVENTFHVLVAQTPPDPLALCAQVLSPVELTIALETAELLPGEYRVLINNEAMEFSIEDLYE